MLNRDEVKRRREALGLTMEEASSRAGFKSRQQWNMIEGGHRKDPAASTVQAVARALGCRMDDLMTAGERAAPPKAKSKPKDKRKG